MTKTTKLATLAKVAKAQPILVIDKSSGNVFADIGLPDADVRLANAQRARSSMSSDAGRGIRRVVECAAV